MRPSACYLEAYTEERGPFVSEGADTSFPPEEVCAQAQGNAAAWILTMIAYLKERGSAVEDCVAYHGRSFVPVWEWLRGRPVEEVAQLVALNALSVGASIRSLSSEDGRAELLVEGWPDVELMGFLPLDRDDCDQIWDTYEPIMEHLGLRYGWQRQDDIVRITIEPQSGR